MASDPIELPPPDVSHPLLNESIAGVPEMRRFWQSGRAIDLPDDPELVVAMDWVNRIAEPFGFEQPLRRLRLTHQKVMERYLMPMEREEPVDLKGVHPVILLHLLWRIGVQICRDGYDDMRRLLSQDRCPFWNLHALWLALRNQLIDSSFSPPVTFGTVDTLPPSQTP
jgi:hypothetical protein